MERLGRLACLVATLAALVTGCSTEEAAEGTEAGPCNGSITTEPSVIAVLPSELFAVGPPALLAKGTMAYLLSNDQTASVGTVTAVDLCSQTTSTLASFNRIGGAIIVEDAMLLSVDRGSGSELVRMPLDGGEVETVAGLSGTLAWLEPAGTRVVVVNAGADGVYDYFVLSGNELVRFYGTEEPQPPPEPDPFGGTSTLTLVGASEAGVYVRRSQHGALADLHLIPFDGGLYPDLSYTAGAQDIAVWGDRLFAAADNQVVSVGLWGGTHQVLLERGSGHTGNVRRILVDGQFICWLPARQSPRCMPQGGGEVRSFGDAAATALELSDGVLVWTVDSEEGPKLMAAIP